MVLSSGDNMKLERDPCLDTLLLLDGEVFVAEREFSGEVRCERGPGNTGEARDGLDYSLTLHDGDERLLGFDNAHSIREGSGPGARTRIEYDHKHKGERVRFYDYKDAMTLLTDFWTEVELILKERSLEAMKTLKVGIASREAFTRRERLRSQKASMFRLKTSRRCDLNLSEHLPR